MVSWATEYNFDTRFLYEVVEISYNWTNEYYWIKVTYILIFTINIF